MTTNKPNIALVVLPTGSGKTGIAVLAPFVLNSTRVLVITPSVKLTEQISNNFGYLFSFNLTSLLFALTILFSFGEGPSFYEERGLITGEQLAGFVEPPFAVYKTENLVHRMVRTQPCHCERTQVWGAYEC